MRKQTIVLLVATGLIAVIVGGSLFGYDMWDKGRTFVKGDGQVLADLVQVGSINSGRIISLDVEEGDPVSEGQVIATVDIPAVVSRSDITDTTKKGFRDVQDQRVEVLAPRSGVIVARWAMEGDIVEAGQRIVTLMDPREIRVEANIDEGKIDKVVLGQTVEVDVKSLDDKLMGRVERISRVTVATLMPEMAPSSNVRNMSQVVAVRIALDGDLLSLIPGSTAKIKIQVR